ncbi:MAG: hypothetical protein WD876_03455 [Candidatus Pacearchaeota archaeon]
MIYNKQGLSTIVTTLIIILLSLVAIGIIWVVVSNVLEGGAEQTEINTKCLSVDVRATALSCDDGVSCSVTYNRRAGGEAIDGLRIIISNPQESASLDVEGDLGIGATRTSTVTTTLTGINGAQVAAYFEDSSGTPQFCPPSRAFEI